MKTCEYLHVRGDEYQDFYNGSDADPEETVTRHRDLTEAELDEHGADGWAVVSVCWSRKGGMRAALMCREVAPHEPAP